MCLSPSDLLAVSQNVFLLNIVFPQPCYSRASQTSPNTAWYCKCILVYNICRSFLPSFVSELLCVSL